MANPLFFVENDFGRLGVEFVECDRDTNSRAEVVRLIRNGSLSPRKIIEVIEPCDEYPRGQVTDVTLALIAEAAIEQEPRSLEEIRQILIDYQNDHRRDLRKHGVYGW